MAAPVVQAAGVTAVGNIVGSLLPGTTTTTGTSSATGSSTTKQFLDLSPEGYNKIIRDILASDAGLAALATGENLSGSYSSSVKAQLAQDLVLNIAGEMAKLVAPTISETTQVQESQSQSKSKKKASVICTELVRQGLLDEKLYEAGHAHFCTLSPKTIAGYRIWANRLVPLMQKSPGFSRLFAPMANARYQMIVNGKFSILGAITIYFGQPICYLIGAIILKIVGDKNGNLSTIA